MSTSTRSSVNHQRWFFAPWALDEHRLVVIERDGGIGATALFRMSTPSICGGWPDGFLEKILAVDLARIPDR